jgi:hypothetical protein
VGYFFIFKNLPIVNTHLLDENSHNQVTLPSNNMACQSLYFPKWGASATGIDLMIKCADWQKPHLSESCRVTWDRCYDFLNIFAEKFSENIDVFCSNYC